MKKMLTLVAALFILVAVNQAQTLQSLFDKYSDDERFEYVSIGKGMMNMASAFGGVGKHGKEMMGKMKGIKILTLEASSDSPLMKSVERDLRQVIEDGDFETAVEARDKGERVHIYYRVSGKDNADMLIVTKERGELSLIWMSGRMTKEEMMNSFSNTENKVHIYGNRRSEADTIS
ncbi:MAG: DUF4252 domain-containing protein [Paludibacter sp.]|nr:DUF4252 domain-containing protein [Paludibacter sp.]